ncbi:MAG TPA: oligosaccharide flippase family protein [Candidatus Baltobacteraceae bacterium]|nr:oligosaccharide flippase family protein [Candidatus Baltobacteraceae bacterium]
MATAAPLSERISIPVRRALKNDFLRHGALVFGATMAANVLNYAFNVALSRRLGVEGFATLSSLVSFIMIFSIPASVLTLMVVKYTATFHAAGDTARVRRLSAILLKWTSVAAIVAFVLGVLLHGEVAAFLRIANDPAIPLCIGILALSLITPSVRAILQGEQDFIRYSISVVLENFLKVLLAVALVYAGFGVIGALSGWLLGTFAALAYTVWAVFKKHGSAADASISLGLDVQRLVRTTMGVGFAGAFVVVFSSIDVLLVKHYFTPHEAGLYAAVNLTGKVVLFVAAFVPSVLLPKAAAKHERGEAPTVLLLQAVAVTSVMCGAALVMFGSAPGLVVRILAGADFAAAAPYVLQYDAAMALLAVVTLLVNYRIAIHNFQFLYPFGGVLACEIAAIALFHGTLWDVIHVLLIGNAFAAAVCVYGLSTTRKALVGAVQ